MNDLIIVNVYISSYICENYRNLTQILRFPPNHHMSQTPSRLNEPSTHQEMSDPSVGSPTTMGTHALLRTFLEAKDTPSVGPLKAGGDVPMRHFGYSVNPRR